MDSAGTETTMKMRSERASHLSWSDQAIYVGIVVCSFFGALVNQRFVTADTVAYLDLSDAIRDHRWHAVVNAYWFPLYPALLTIGRACFGFRQQYELMAARLVGALTGLLFVLAAMAVAAAARRLMLARGARVDELLPPGILYVWVATLAYFFCAQDMGWYTPDALVSALMLLTVAAVLWGAAEQSLFAFVAAGLLGGLAYWAKAFAFPFFFLWMLLAAAASLRKPGMLRRLAVSLGVFVLVAGPYVGAISAAKGRFTFGDSGRLDMAWYVNGAVEGNPGWGPPGLLHETAHAHLKHPTELLSSDPRVVYFSPRQVRGTIPEWDDPSYWEDGLSPHFNLGQIEAAVKRNIPAAQAAIMRIPPILLLGVLCYWGYTVRRPSFVDPILAMTFFLAIACIGAYSLVLLEGRYIAFSLVLMGASFASCSLAKQPTGSMRSLHLAVALIAGAILCFAFRLSLLQENVERLRHGAHPLQGIYDMPMISAGTDLAVRFPRGTEVACMGYLACYDDSYWAKYAGLSVTAIIESGHQWDHTSAAEGCQKLDENPSVLDRLKARGVRAVVGRFGGEHPCSTAWQPLEGSGDFYYLPL